MSQPILTSYAKKQDSIDTFFDEWQSIHQSIHQSQEVSNNETDDDLQEKDEQGIYTNSEAIWLEKLGFGSYVSQLETGDGGEGAQDALLTNAGLNKHYTHAIRRRMNTLRSTVRSRKKEVTEEKRRDGEDSPPSQRSSRSTISPSHVVSKVSNVLRGSSPSQSPRASPLSSRRSPSSYNVSVQSEKQSRRKKNGDIDSGVYSANSSRDGTPVGGQQQLGEGLGAGGEARTDRQRSRVVSGSSPIHRSNHPSSSEQNGLPGNRHGTPHFEKGEGVYLDDTIPRNRIDPVSLSLASRPVENSQSQHAALQVSRSTSGLGSKWKGSQGSQGSQDGRGVEVIVEQSSPRMDRVMKRSSSEKPISPPTSILINAADSEQTGKNKRETSKSLPHGGNHLRSISPLPQQGLILNSPEDIKLDFGSVSHSNGSTKFGPDEMQELPNFMISPDALGITRVTDLSQADMEKVRSVALLELTVTFDDHDISLRSRRPARAKSYPENALRGVPLNLLLQADQKRDPKASIPLIFESMISHLETHAIDQEGLLRIPGNRARINSLMQNLEESFQFGQFSFSGLNSNDVCSLLKQFIRELPVPLLTREYLPVFASIADISGLKEQVRTLNLLILLLPDVHQRVLKRLLEFFDKVTQNSSTNKMDLTNVAMVIAPNLFIRLPSRQSMDQIAMATKTSHIVRLLIKYHHLLWTIPGEMLRQIRYLYENEVRRLNPRSVQKAIKQMQHQLMEQQPSRGITIPEVSHHIIRVKAPLFTRVCMAVDICVGVTAGDIITKLQKKSRLNQDVIRKRFSSSFSENKADSPIVENMNKLKLPEDLVKAGEQFLFEVGGNIGERCLPNNTDMYSLYSVNPNAQWVIKPRDCPDLQ